METWRRRDMETWKHETEAEAISLIRLRFAHCANGSLSFVRLLTKKQRSYPFANRLNGLNGLDGLALLWSIIQGKPR
jgi:hypothetical protein